MNRINKSSWKHFDIALVLIVLAIFIMGTLALGNSTGKATGDETGLMQTLSNMNTTLVRKNILWFGTGIIVAGLLVYLDYEVLSRMSNLIYLLNMGMLVLVLIMGRVTYGATAWLNLFDGRLGVQPSEIAKLALIISLAKRLSLMNDGVQTFRELMIVLAYVGIPFILLLLQNDLGTGMVYLFITAVMIFTAGCNWKLLLMLVGCAGAVAYPAWLLLGDVQRNRILVFLDPSLDPMGAGMNVRMATMAVGSGGMKGLGFFNPSSLTQLNFIPVSASDFLFSVAAETFGFFITAFIILLYALLILRLIILSRRSFDRFGSYLIIGVMAMMSFHIFENIGMNIGVMPVTGIPLPFFSYGGSNMWTNMAAIGMTLSVVMRQERGIFQDPENY